ncbi:alpha/beta hydrolase [Paenibacillus donghaensis]|uniref:Alpha/beta hydrolase n=1 Tax=Paenibacillus donghaensis TaxID=414771 RepID=A0A2Z2KAE4_9BACL|nr:alpha/beta hydrolase [Paenibacillus donghaensis]ASA22447.1 alpha/beta hydrolase [Paenibacillus donghaensis]
MKKWRKRLKRTLLFGGLAIVLLLVSSLVVEQVNTRKDLKSYTPSGKLYNVNGKNMHLYTGGQGDVTVVLASGWGTANPYIDFYPLYDKLAPHVKFAVYDRFGYGYSDTTDKKRDVDTISSEIHQLLQESGQKPPYVLVSHSLGSLETIRFAQKYPDEVQAMVMLDSGSPEFYYDGVDVPASGGFGKQLLIHTGVLRMLLTSDSILENSRATRNGLKFVPDELKAMDIKATLLKLSNANIDDELAQHQANAKIVLDHKQTFTFPFTVLTSDYFGKSEEDWTQSQAKFPSWSVQGKQVMIKDSEHYIHQFHPDLVADEILAAAKR